jgi:hypothetical protein
MADAKISELSAGTALAGTEVTPFVQGGATVKITGTQVKTFALTTPLAVVGNATAGAELRLPEDTDNGSNYVALKAPDNLGATYTLTFPADDGAPDEVLKTNGSGVLSWTASGGSIAPLVISDANTVHQRNSTTGQTFQIYNTYTDASNYERLALTWGSNIITIGPEAAGTGTLRNMILGAGSMTQLSLAVGGGTFVLGREGAVYGALTIDNILRPTGVLLAERTAPGTPPANTGIIYTEDNGSGKTRLMVLFQSGAAQQIAIEP